jgi:hypothetical protein
MGTTKGIMRRLSPPLGASEFRNVSALGFIESAGTAISQSVGDVVAMGKGASREESHGKKQGEYLGLHDVLLSLCYKR